jgi:dipeptidyl aminopeptidase/acylaminoacyl peptidase
MSSPFLAALAPALAPVPPAVDAHPFSIDDVLAAERVSKLAVAPDGSTAVVVVQRPDRASDTMRSDLWLVDLERGGARRLTTHEKGDGSPRFSADGRSVWFVSSRSGSSQVWRIPVDGGEATQVSKLPVDVGSFAVRPDGGLVVAVSVHRSAATLQATADALAATAASKEKVYAYDRLMVRHWDAWSDGRQTHLFAVDADGAIRALTTTLDGTVEGPWEVTKDGRYALFALRPAAREAWSTVHHLYGVPVAGGEPVLLTPDDPAWSFAPTVSPDGHTLAYRAQRIDGYESDRWRVVLRDLDAGDVLSVGPARWITEAWDRSVGSVVWARDGQRVFAIADNLGSVGLFEVTTRGVVSALSTSGSVDEVAVAGDRLALLMNDFAHPNEVFTLRPGRERSLVRVSAFNDGLLATTRPGAARQITFTGAHGDRVYAWVVVPPGEAPPGGWPVALIVHGGPQGTFADRFSYRWNPNVYAGHGYAAVMVDFHGSTGYGQSFTDAIQGDWGGAPLEDLDRGLEAALREVPELDGARVAALGASYGGYMMFWIAGQRPDRFRCIVAHDGVFSPRALWFDTEELFFPERDLMGTPWANPVAYAKHDPSAFVDRWKAPMLVIQGERDFRVPTSHALGAFNALQRQGIPSRMLLFPTENHWILGAANSARWHAEVLAWLDKWTMPASP